MAEVSIGLRCPLRIPPPISIQLPGTDFLLDGEDTIAKGATDPELIFVTNITNYIRGEKICHVEKFQFSMYDNCVEN